MAQDDNGILKVKILWGIANNHCLVGEVDNYGKRYSVDFSIDVKGRNALVRTTWIIKNKENSPRLTSCYIFMNYS